MALLEIEKRDPAPAATGGWLTRFTAALETRDEAALADCFVADGYWKDMLAFTWAYRTFSGAGTIAARLAETADAVQFRTATLAPKHRPPCLVRRSGREVVEAFLDIETDAGRATGVVRLVADNTGPDVGKAWMLLTALQELRGYEEPVGARRPSGLEYARNFAGANWLDIRRERQRFAERDPEVLIVGGGQAGLILAARLGRMGVDTLIVERLPRVGDNWRNRYHSLTLHNEVWANHLPYMPFPDAWPAFVPKDKLAGWLEAYAEAMELNVWTGTEFTGGRYDEAAAVWTVSLRNADGGDRTMRVPHLVFATGGTSSVPRLPRLPGLDEFGGDVIHSSRFTTGMVYAGRRAIVVGTGNSGHDVAQDLYSNGASVTMIQRGPTTVVTLVPSAVRVYAMYQEGLPVDEVDLLGLLSLPYPVLLETLRRLTLQMAELDRELLDRLHAVGFKTDLGEDGTGFFLKYYLEGGGYYINVGCSELLADRKIGLVQADDVDRFVPTGLRLADGTTLDADLVVLATGYEGQQDGIRRLVGDDVADRVGPVWGVDEHHLMRNMWQRTNQPGCWVAGSNFVDCRIYSRFLALQIKAALTGLLPAEPLV